MPLTPPPATAANQPSKRQSDKISSAGEGERRRVDKIVGGERGLLMSACVRAAARPMRMVGWDLCSPAGRAALVAFFAGFDRRPAGRNAVDRTILSRLFEVPNLCWNRQVNFEIPPKKRSIYLLLCSGFIIFCQPEMPYKSFKKRRIRNRVPSITVLTPDIEFREANRGRVTTKTSRSQEAHNYKENVTNFMLYKSTLHSLCSTFITCALFLGQQKKFLG
jgi:hypothetical protein